MEKSFFFHFKRYNLTIHAVNFCETFCTCSSSSLGQDLTIESAESKLFSIWASWVRSGSFGVFFEKKSLCPLTPKIPSTFLTNFCSF
jgi:hypothetical protein